MTGTFGLSAGEGFQNQHLIPKQSASSTGMKEIARVIGFDFDDPETNRIRLPQGGTDKQIAEARAKGTLLTLGPDIPSDLTGDAVHRGSHRTGNIPFPGLFRPVHALYELLSSRRTIQTTFSEKLKE